MTSGRRLDRIERSIAQIASALRVTVGYRPEPSGAYELQEILDEQRALIEREKENVAT